MQESLLRIVAVFGAGLISFLSPCVLPLVPGYISFITGFSADELSEGQPQVRKLLIPSLLFVVGFTLVFVALGASASILGALLSPYRAVLTRAAGALIILMGVFMLGIIKLPGMYGEMRFDSSRTRALGRGASFVMGMAFAFGWTPCVGPILASVLALAGSSTNVSQGALLLLVYSAGLGVPFVATGLLFGRLRGALRFLSRYSLTINRIAGVLLIVMGILIVTNRLVVIGAWMLKILPFAAG